MVSSEYLLTCIKYFYGYILAMYSRSFDFIFKLTKKYSVENEAFIMIKLYI